MRKSYPRPNFVRKEWLSLNGEWEFIFDDNNEGLDKKYFNKSTFPLKINVPFAYESKLSGINDTSFHDHFWYKKKVTIPSSWKEKRVLINFGAVDYECHLFVNGHKCGHHIGGHSSFSFDITPYLNYNEEDITLYVIDYGQKETQPRGKQFWEEKSRVIWYTRTSGIWQSVFLECVEDTYLTNVLITPNIDEGMAYIKTNFNTNIDNAVLEVKVMLGNKLVNKVTTRVNGYSSLLILDIFKNKIMDGSFHGKGLCWSPENPVLFDCYLTLKSDRKIFDEVKTYFGMRKISVKNKKIYLNNKPYYLKMVLDQGYWEDGLLSAPSDEDYLKDIKLTKALGFNGVRKHQKVEDPLYLYYADKEGLLVWGEMANSASYDEEYAQNFVKEWGEVVIRDYNHPCIIAWVPMNESWGVPDLISNPAHVSHINALYYYTKSLDSTRLVESNDGWELATTDICTVHHYGHGELDNVKQHEKFKKTLSDRELLVNKPSTAHDIFLDGYSLEDKPIVLSEFGGVSYGIEKGFGYSTVRSEEDFLKSLEIIFDAVYSSKVLSGFCYTQLYDVEQENNGLLTYQRVPKSDLSKLNKIITNKK